MKHPLIFLLLITCTACTTKQAEPSTPDESAAELPNWTDEERMYLINELTRTRNEVVAAASDLSDEQWNFRETEERWSIAEVIEHLEIQDEMYFREMDIIPRRPETPEYAEIVKGNDSLLLAYATDPVKGDAGYLKPIGRFCSREEAIAAFVRIRNMMLDIVQETDENLRLHFTFRNYRNEGSHTDPGIFDVRDLHQLMLTCIAHTDRHLTQIKNVKAHAEYPQE